MLHRLCSFFLAGMAVFQAASSVMAEDLSDYDFRGLQTRIDRYEQSGQKSAQYDYYAPSLVPGQTSVYALKVITTSFDVINYEPRRPVEDVYLVDCANRSVTGIISVSSFADLSELPPAVVRRFDEYNSKTLTRVKGFEVKRESDKDALWTISESAALEIVCAQRS